MSQWVSVPPLLPSSNLGAPGGVKPCWRAYWMRWRNHAAAKPVL